MTLTKNREAKRGKTKIHISQDTNKSKEITTPTNRKIKKRRLNTIKTLTRVFRNRIYKGGGSGGGR